MQQADKLCISVHAREKMDGGLCYYRLLGLRHSYIFCLNALMFVDFECNILCLVHSNFCSDIKGIERPENINLCTLNETPLASKL